MSASVATAIVVIDWLAAAITAGINATVAIDRMSAFLRERHAAGQEFTPKDLAALFNTGDSLEAAAARQFADTLANPDTPRA